MSTITTRRRPFIPRVALKVEEGKKEEKMRNDSRSRTFASGRLLNLQCSDFKI